MSFRYGPNRLAVFGLDTRRELPLGQLRLLSRLDYHLTKSSHRLLRRLPFVVNGYVGTRLFIAGATASSPTSYREGKRKPADIQR